MCKGEAQVQARGPGSARAGVWVQAWQRQHDACVVLLPSRGVSEVRAMAATSRGKGDGREVMATAQRVRRVVAACERGRRRGVGRPSQTIPGHSHWPTAISLGLA